MFSNIRQDIKRYTEDKSIFHVFINLDFYITLNYRIGHFFYNIKLYPISKIFWLINRILFSVDINMKADIGGGFVIHHGIGIIIGAKVKALGPLTIYQQVTLGGNHGKTVHYKGNLISMPYLKENVILYPGSKVLGPVVIGENSKVAVNAIVTREVDKNQIVINKNEVIKNAK